MKLLVWLMLVLPAVSSVSSMDKPKLALDPRLGGIVPKIIPNRPMARDNTPLNIEKRSLSSSWKIDQTNLEWQTWTGSLPSGAVSIWNTYLGHRDYVCKHGCNAGFYNPDKGGYCHYTENNKGYSSHKFEILVNKENFEILEWKDDSHGSVPHNSVKTCSGRESPYVGKIKYGLGEVVPNEKVFYLPWKGSWYHHSAYSYSYYKVLTFDRDITSEQISNVKYMINNAKIHNYPPKTVHKSTISNNECHKSSKTVTLSKTSQVEHRWDTSFSTGLGVRKSFTGKIPVIAPSGIELSAETTFQYNKDITHTESIPHSVSVQYDVPPNHSCTVRMLGHNYEANIPFTARISRTYRKGETKWMSISGTYKSVQLRDVQAVLDRCEPIPNAKSCFVKKKYGKG